MNREVVAMTMDQTMDQTMHPTMDRTNDEVVAVLAWCDNPWCGALHDPRDGWGGHCPSCLALADEHLSGVHAVVIEACVECRREPRRVARGRRPA